ncbi:CotH kinase family protein [bacterium]|nr:CotH kinase family protein [bacterium]
MRNLIIKLSLIVIGTIQMSWALDHWETAIYANDSWKYLIGDNEPPLAWKIPGFDDSSWLNGTGGIGYGDGDDATIIDQTVALYLRKSIDVENLDLLEIGLLHFDYDDGFIAYLNGVEIYRTFNMGVSGSFVPFDAGTSMSHEAIVYQGQLPEMQILDSEVLAGALVEGENILAIQLQNYSSTSTDLTGLFWLSFGIADGSNPFGPVPEWFYVPFLFTSSNLPIICINTSGQSIPDEPKITAHMGIIDNGPGITNHLSDPFNDYDGFIGIEIRGASSQMFPKKQYAVETRDSVGENNNVELLGFPSENDWILYAPFSDKSLIRNALAYTLASQTGHYASRNKFCEVVLNGEYQGVYVLLEKIKRDNNRVDIATLNPDEIEGDDLTGGYIIKIDKWAGEGNDSWFSDPEMGEYGGVNYQYHYPKPDEIVPEQREYIQNFITDFEQMFIDGSYLDPEDGYYNKIDWESFVDYAIIQEFAKNVDGYRLSSFLYKDKDSNDPSLHTGPIWDFNLGFGNADYYGGGLTTGWYMDTDFGGDSWVIPFWWYLMWEDPVFRYAFNVRWQELRQDVLSDEHVFSVVDSMVSVLGTAAYTNFDRWPILGQYIWPNAYVGGNYPNEMAYLRTWISVRMTWIDSETIETGIVIPEDQQVGIAYPNPFNPSQILNLNVENEGQISIDIYDIQGRLVNKLPAIAGENGLVSINWDGRDSHAAASPSGIYFLVIQDMTETISFKVTLLR